MRWIAEWEWDEDNLAELAAHGLARRTVLSVSTEAPRFRRNKRRRAATHQMIGPDSGGTMWVVCIVETAVQGRWRAITGWKARDAERTWYEGAG